jgi:hypothetical protein
MQSIPKELLDAINSRLKAGDKKPVCRVEVDRMVFIPGRTENVDFLVQQLPDMTVEDSPLDDSGVSTVNSASIVFPVEGHSLNDVSSPYGKRGSGFHYGIDIAANMGTNVLACWDGKVSFVSTSNAYSDYGYYIDIIHQNNIRTRYAHLSKILVKKGDTVKAGQVIGKIGNTGHVTYNGVAVTGSYSDPNSQRSKGLGSHLHFEIQLPNSKGGYDAVDPKKYLDGTNNLFTNYSNSSQTISTVTGKPGTVVLNEKFLSKDWYKNSKYSVDQNFEMFSSVGSTTGVGYSGMAHTFTFNPKYKRDISTGFDIKLHMTRSGFMNVGYISTLGNYDKFTIKVNGKLYVSINNFPFNKYQQVNGIPIPEGDVGIRFDISWTLGSKIQYFSLTNILVQELIPNDVADSNSILVGDKSLDNFILSDTNVEYWDLENVDNFVFNDRRDKVSLQVGEFVYSDTLVLDNVQSIDIDCQYEMESAEATVVISNKDGLYNPDYEPGSFPDFYRKSEWSTYINGVHVGVLSENTPIRIYLGYGQNLQRVFTGLIDKVDVTGDTLTITCRDMYKKIINKVLTETKAYPKVIDPTDTTPVENLDRRQTIIYQAQLQASKFGVDPLFLLAIAQLETQMGTAGWGRAEKGDYILGYGCYSDTDADPDYAGIDKQMYYGAKRMHDALGSRNYQINSLDDVKYFHDGGDLGTSYRWNPDSGWADMVWQIYQEIKSNPSNWTVNVDTTQSNDGNDKVAWVKSAVVQDLVAHAGMFGWRANSEDLNYPDAVIEETYLIEADQKTGMVLKAVPDKEGEFTIEPITSTLTPQGWMNPFVEAYGKTFEAYKYHVNECINEVIKDINYRSYCDRYGTYRLERIRLNTPVVAEFTDKQNLLTILKTIDLSRVRSHLVIVDDVGNEQHYIDKELLMDLKGELRTAVISAPWARTEAAKREVAKKAFYDMKRLSKTLQVSIVGNPALDILDNVVVSDKFTTTRNTYTIKGIRTSFSLDNGYIQIIDLTWMKDGQIV